MITLNFGPCARRSAEPRKFDDIELPEADLSRLFDFVEFTDNWCFGNKIVLDFFGDCSKRWAPPKPMTILDLFCGRGDLAAVVVEWAEKNGHSVNVLAVDPSKRKIELARRRHGHQRRIQFEVRDLKDPSFLNAQQFDYVITSGGMNGLSLDQIPLFLKTANLLAKRGLMLSDWLRDVRAVLWLSAFAWTWRNPSIRHDAPLLIRRGFTPHEMKKFALDAGIDYLQTRSQWGYRFSIAGERAYVMAAQLATAPRLAGI